MGLSGLGSYSTGIAAFAGRALFSDDEFAEQRLALATETFYRNAELVADHYRAITCTDLDAPACGTQFISNFVEPLFERPLTLAERDYYLDLFINADTADRDGQRAAMIAALSSPHFLFRKEAADEQ